MHNRLRLQYCQGELTPKIIYHQFQGLFKIPITMWNLCLNDFILEGHAVTVRFDNNCTDT